METWVIITVAAAFLQNIRSATQKHLTGSLTTLGATFVRFGFGLPFACLFMGLMHLVLQMPLPLTNKAFWVWVVIAGAMQIGAQGLLLASFSHSSFTVGTAYSRTEAVQAALLGFVLLGDRIPLAALVAIAIAVAGVIILAVARSSLTLSGLLAALGSRAAWIGLASGAGFGLSATAYRAASLALAPGLPEPNFLMQAGFTLLVTIAMQSLALFAWMAFRDRGEIARIARVWKWGLLAGASGASASFGWFMGFTLQAAAIIKALAQVEMLFTYFSTIVIFREKVTPGELLGCALIILGIVVLVLGQL
ncbi:MAG: DMT family transporter [Rhizobiaceae bacterium]